MAGADLWRIARRPYGLDRLGTGARESGSRWNNPGTGVIYASRSIALAALEKFVHLAGIIPGDLVLVRLELPDSCSAEEPRLTNLPRDWNRIPAGPASAAFGTSWAAANRSLVLYIPSVLVPEEKIAVLNPNHPEFASVKMSVERDFHYDPRMFLPKRLARRKAQA